MGSATTKLEKAVADFKNQDDIIKASEFVRDTMLPAMDKLCAATDKAKTLTAESNWQFQNSLL